MLRASLFLLSAAALAPASVALTWTELTPPNAPSARHSQRMGYDQARDRVILFGGGPALGSPYGDTWELDLASGLWSQLFPPTSPSARLTAAGASDGTRLFLHGGSAGSPPLLEDLWIFDYASDIWSMQLPAVRPSPRFDHAGLWDPASAAFVIFGGFEQGMVSKADLWAFDPATGLWAQLPAGPNPPPVRTNCFFATSGNGTYYVFGGHDDTTTLTDTWAWDGSWRPVSPTTSPTSREHQTSFYLPSTGLLYQWFGNVDDHRDDRAELWAFSPTQEDWTNLTPAIGGPPGRRHTDVAVDSAAGRVITFGGRNVTTAFADTWVLSDLDPGQLLLAIGGVESTSSLSEVQTWEAASLPIPRHRFAPYGTVGASVNVDGADLDGNGVDELLTGPGGGAVFGPHLRGFRPDGTPMPRYNLFAYQTLRYGVHPASGELDGDGEDEAITGAGPGAVFGPHVRGFSPSALPGLSFFSYATLRFGVRVAGADLDGSGRHEILTGPGPSPVFGANVRGFRYDGTRPSSIGGLNAVVFASGYGCGPGAGPLDATSPEEILATPGPDPSTAGSLKVFRWTGTNLVLEATAATAAPGGGPSTTAYDGVGVPEIAVLPAGPGIEAFRLVGSVLVPVVELTFPAFGGGGIPATTVSGGRF